MAALASYLDARANQGSWLLRMEDLDPPRESPAAASRILLDLEGLGLCWDGPVVYQSQRHLAYNDAIAALSAAGHTFWCTCSRQTLADAGGRYPGTCRELQHRPHSRAALRCRVPDDCIRFTDQWQGSQIQHLQQDAGDFIIKRKDGLYAYQLAVVVDDAWQGITHVVRGIDLLESTPRQIHLQRLLGLPTPCYAHIPVLVNHDGQKLSKQNHAEPVPTEDPSAVLYEALVRLQQQPDPQLLHADRDDLLTWALQHWKPERLTGLHSIPDVSAVTPPAV